MDEMIKVIDDENRITWVNPNNITDVTYGKRRNVTTIGLVGHPDNYIEIKGVAGIVLYLNAGVNPCDGATRESDNG